MSDIATRLRNHADKLIGYEELDEFIQFQYWVADQFDDYEKNTRMRVNTIDRLGKQVRELQLENARLKEEKVAIDRVTADIPVGINLVASWEEKVQ